MDRAFDVRSRLEVGGGPNKPGFKAADRKAVRLSERQHEELAAICKVRPVTPEGALAAAIYLRARYIEADFTMDGDELTILNGFLSITRSLASRRRSPAFQRVLGLVNKIKVATQKRHVAAKKWEKSIEAKRQFKKAEQIKHGPTVIEVATEARTLRMAARILTSLVPPDADNAIAMVEARKLARD
jgi:hypothetical protein